MGGFECHCSKCALETYSCSGVFDEYLFYKYNVERWDNGVSLEADYTREQSLCSFIEL